MWQVFQCPQCGAQNYQGQQVCWNCGMQFVQQQSGWYQQSPQQSPQQQYQQPAQPPYQHYQQPMQPQQPQYQQPMQQPGMRYQQPYGYGPQAPQKKSSSSGFIFLICVVVLLFAVAAIGILSEGTFFLPSKSEQPTTIPATEPDETPTDTTDTTPKTAVQVGAGTLIVDYMLDETASDTTYKGEFLEITGMVERMGETGEGLPYVMLGGGGETEEFSVQCLFAVEDKTAVEALQIGGNATIQGTCDGYAENVIVKDCSIK